MGYGQTMMGFLSCQKGLTESKAVLTRRVGVVNFRSLESMPTTDDRVSSVSKLHLKVRISESISLDKSRFVGRTLHLSSCNRSRFVVAHYCGALDSQSPHNSPRRLLEHVWGWATLARLLMEY